MKKRVADFRRRFGHEHARLRLAAHQHRQCADVVLMRMRNDDRVEPPAAERVQIRQRLFALELRMHPAIEDQAMPGSL